MQELVVAEVVLCCKLQVVLERPYDATNEWEVGSTRSFFKILLLEYFHVFYILEQTH